MARVTVAGVVTDEVPTDAEVSVQVAPVTPGVLMATVCVVPLTIVAQPAKARKTNGVKMTFFTQFSDASQTRNMFCIEAIS